MAPNSKAIQIGEVLEALAYHDFDFLGEALYIRDYQPILADERRISTEAEKQTEQHLLLHHGIPLESGGTMVRDDWYLDCSRQFLSHFCGSFSKDILEYAERLGVTEKVSVKEKVVTFTMGLLRDLDERHEQEMRSVTSAVRTREGLGPRDAEATESLIKQWSQDDDRVTDYYAAWLGQRFPGIVDRAEKLNAIAARTPVPQSVQRYLTEASRSYICGQYIACLAVCRAAIEIALGDFLIRNGRQEELRRLGAEKRDGLSARIDIAQSLGKWKLKFTLDAAREVKLWARVALHEEAVDSEKCKELFFKARGVLRDLYS